MNAIDVLIAVARLSAEPGFTVEAAIDCQCSRHNASSVDRFVLEHLWTFSEYPHPRHIEAFKKMQINLM